MTFTIGEPEDKTRSSSSLSVCLANTSQIEKKSLIPAMLIVHLLFFLWQTFYQKRKAEGNSW